jgi:hypothetical protein
MSCKTYLYKGQSLTEEQLIQVLSIDPKIVEAYKAQEEREGSDYEREDRVTFERKVDALKKTMNVEVIYDDNIESSRLLGRNDPRTKAAGKPVILINPNQLFKTTAIHEFGHVFIDAFPGGLENKRLQRALDQLRNTALWTEVKELYPDLSESMFHKEVLATAIGREGAEIWADGENQSKWESFMAWLSDFLKRALGLERNEVVRLSKELLNDRVKDISATQIEEIAQELRPRFVSKAEENKTEADKDFDSLEAKIEKGYNNLLGVITKIYRSQIKTTESAKRREKKNVKAGKVTRLSSIRDLQEKLKKYENSDKKFGFVRYLNWARKELYFMKNEIDRRENENKLDDNALKKAYNWSASFGVLEEIQSLLEDLRTSDIIDEKEIKTIRGLLIELNGIRDEIDSKLLKGSRKLYAELLAKHDTETEEEFKLGFKETYAELSAVGDPGMQEGEYIIQEMQANKDEIEDVKLRKAEERAKTSITKMSKLSMLLLSEKEMKAKDIQLISKLLDGASQNIEKYATEEATNEDAANKKFKEYSNHRNMKKKYEGMFVTSEDGVSYYTGEYKPEFIEEKNRMAREMGDQEIYDAKYNDIHIVEKADREGTIEFYYKSTIPSSKTGKTINRKLSIPGAREVKVEGLSELAEGERAMHVSYKLSNGKRITIPINEAIARSEYSHWKAVNTKTEIEKINGQNVKRTLPVDKWIDPRYEELKKNSPEKFAELQRLKQNNRLTDAMYDKKDSIIEKYKSAEFMRLPGVMKTTTSRIAEGQSIKTMGKNALSRMIETQEDDFDVETYTDFKEGETLRLPAPYRAKLKENDQSFDLHTIGLLHSIMGKNYQEKKAIESTLLVLTEVMAKKKYPVLDSVTGKQKIDAQTKLPLWESGNKSAELSKAQSMIENRLYSITTKQAGGFKVAGKTVETQQVIKTGLKYFGTVSLVFNYANSIVNTTTGTFSNLIEAVGGDTYNLRDYKKAQQLYNFDLKNIMADMGVNVNKSRTNLLMSNFNTMGPAHIKNNFEEGSRMEGLMNQDSLRPLANMGEHMMQGKVMYAILNSIKVQNKKGQWIDINGQPTTSKSKAASMHDMITFKTNAKGGQQMVLHPAVQNTSFTTGGGQEAILLETRNLIRSKVDELHGQYTNDIQAHAQRYMLGKMGFFLRKWMIPGYLRRFRGIQNAFKPSDAELKEADEFYSADQKNHMEGYYISTIRFLSKLVSDTREDGINISKSWKELTPKQQAGIRKTIMDVALMTAVTLAYGIMEGDGDIDDEDIFLAYLLRRQMSELTTFANPVEAFKIAQTPTAAVGNLKQIFKTMNYMTPWSWGDRYKVGPYKGDLKLYHKSKRLLPRFKNNEDFKQSLDFLRTMSM